ncbi:MAG: sugar phosphate nucleotidyltransferase [Rhizobium sp.]|nr:sugar phosphate nucleotidyltransferase [Rhizobium sp.]MCZ8350676.1 sugar phosphate nucleotidyltransferase [Rhizobium sp.]
MTLIRPVVLCGGSGTRLWPLSRRLEPKQFQKLAGDHSLFQDTLARFEGPEFGRATVLVNMVQEPRVQFDLQQIDHTAGLPTVLVEPAMRSTAPAIAAAALALAAEDPDAVMLVVPSDHRIGRHDRLVEAYRAALPFVEQGGIALFGIRPTAPETGFGYIEADVSAEGEVLEVISFVEKPALEIAMQLVAGGRHTWNSGIFMFRALSILGELAHHAPAVLNAVTKSIREGRHEGNRLYLSPAFSEAPEISIDHAVMEHSARLGVVPVSPDWNDLGSFEALWEVGDRNADNNVLKGDALLRNVHNSYINTGRRLVSVIGLSDIVLVDTDDVLLVASRAQSQDVKFIAQHLAKIAHPAADRHVLRRDLTGSRQIIDDNEDFTVERLELLAGATLHLDPGESDMSRTLTLLSGELDVRGPSAEARMTAGKTREISAGEAMAIHNPASRPAIFHLSTMRRLRIVADTAPSESGSVAGLATEIRKVG